MEHPVDASREFAAARARPALVWGGIGLFFLGSVLFGDTLAGTSEPFEGPILLLFGVGAIGGGFLCPPADEDLTLEPELEFEGWQRIVVGVAAVLATLAGVGLLLARFV
jgi:hypothetical protein